MDKYILKAYLGSVLYCFTAFCLIYVILDLFHYLSRFMEAGTPVRIIAVYYGLWVLPFLEYLFPATLLFATLYTLWRLARTNEITAMRACAVSRLRIMAPFLGVGLAFTLLTMSIKEWAVPASRAWVENFRSARFRYEEDLASEHISFIYHDPHQRTVWTIDQLDIHAPQTLHGVTITQARENGTRLRKITARKAQWLDAQWWLFGGEVQAYHDSPFNVPRGAPRILPGAGREFPELASVQPRDIAIQYKSWESQSLSTADMVRHLQKMSHGSGGDLAEKRTALHFRLAIPWACLVVTLFGIPIGLRNSRQGILACIALALACFVGFYALLHAGVFLGRNGIVPPWLGAWLSNMFFLGAGLFMIRRV